MTEEEQQVADAQRVQNFLADPAVVAAFGRLEQQYFADFTKGSETSAWLSAWARHRALMDLKQSLNVVVDNGKKLAADNARRTGRAVTMR